MDVLSQNNRKQPYRLSKNAADTALCQRTDGTVDGWNPAPVYR